MVTEGETQRDPILDLADLAFAVMNGWKHVSELEQAIDTQLALPFYEKRVRPLLPSARVSEDALRERIASTIKQLQVRVQDAREHEGETEVREALEARSAFWARIGDIENATRSYEAAFQETVAVGPKLDICFALFRLGLAMEDRRLMRRELARARDLLAKGSDWERRNRLRVYDALHRMYCEGEWLEASEAFLDGLATFTATELLSFPQFVFYAVVCCLATRERPVLQERVASSPEVLQVIDNYPAVRDCLNAFVSCDYLRIMQTLPSILEQVRKERLLHRYEAFLGREIRLAAYAQYLRAYKSVSLTNMAAAFGVREAFLDAELARFINADRLSVKIDRITGIIVASRPDSRSGLYQEVLKHGDALLNRLQKLSRIIDV
jgi:26S proteasome regulatory subunit N7